MVILKPECLQKSFLVVRLRLVRQCCQCYTINMKEHRFDRHAVHRIRYHLVWVTKRGKPVLIDGVGERLHEIIDGVAADNDWRLLHLTVRENYVRLLLEATPRRAPYQIIHAFKSRSSRKLRGEFPHLLKLPSLWTRAYYVATADGVCEETIRRYVEKHGGR